MEDLISYEQVESQQKGWQTKFSDRTVWILGMNESLGCSNVNNVQTETRILSNVIWNAKCDLWCDFLQGMIGRPNFG